MLKTKTVPITLIAICTAVTRLAFLFTPKLERSAVAQVPT